MGATDDEVRKLLIRYANFSRTRIVPYSSEMPCDWRPQQTVDPRSGEVFTDAGAWEFIVECMANGHDIKTIELRKPPGKRGYVMKIPGEGGRPAIYVKLQLGSNRVFGRSFHYSDPE